MERKLRVTTALLVGMAITYAIQITLSLSENDPSPLVGRVLSVLTIPAGAICTLVLRRGSTYIATVLLADASVFVFYAVLTWVLLGRPWRRFLGSR
jgi:hypothetical protein